MADPSGSGPKIEVRRSKRRRRTVSAYRDGDTIIVLIPDRLSKKEEAEWVEQMVARLQRSERRKRKKPSDADLMRRARALSDSYLGGMANPESVRWVTNQRSRWGSCTPSDRAIRLSTRLQPMPSWVIDYVLIHELAHLLEPNHDTKFWAWVDRYPQAERAKGYLLGWSTAARLDEPPGHADDGTDDDDFDDVEGFDRELDPVD
ncbi:M48 family metallopeptidase [Nocardioides sp.]|uniref:M48 metallopeptidase family protein n=1 Tax=Nocardioides sp. TaxID=35761 RepID=UPI002605D65F|nr:M48 family metallopeptidase [Nocardioides sp.]